MVNLIPRITQKFRYETLKRIDSPTGRTYKPVDRDVPAVPSVTTILSGTKDMEALDAWKARVGEEEAKRIKEEAAYVGTKMHLVIECLLAREPLLMDCDDLSLLGYEMGFKLVNTYFQNLQEVWASEVSLYYPGLYAGTTDLVAIYRGKLAIVDFKQSLRPKRKQYIQDYFHQLAAYAAAHDVAHGTNIDFGAILVAVQDGTTQEFTTAGSEFQEYKRQWMERVKQYREKNGLA